MTGEPSEPKGSKMTHYMTNRYDLFSDGGQHISNHIKYICYLISLNVF